MRLAFHLIRVLLILTILEESNAQKRLDLLRIVHVAGNATSDDITIPFVEDYFRRPRDYISTIPEVLFHYPKFPIHPSHRVLIPLEQRLETLSSRLRNLTHLEEITRVLKEVGNELNREIPDGSKVRELQTYFKENIEVPNWFKTLMLCFKVKDDSSKRLCGLKGGEKLACSHFHKFTDLYLDQKRKGEGCGLSWGLFASSEVDEWFKDVQICVSIKVTGTDIADERCARLNQFTEEHHYHYTKKHSVLTKWKISFDARDSLQLPLWLRDTAICYTHKAVERTLIFFNSITDHSTRCAPINSYTSAYLDGFPGRRGLLIYREKDIAWAIRNDFVLDAQLTQKGRGALEVAGQIVN